MRIADKTILITGASRGIGRALLDEALRRGALRVYAGTRSPLRHPDKRVTPLQLDVTDVGQIQRAAEEVGSLDVLINNAGVAVLDDLNDLDVIGHLLGVNFFGWLKVTQAFLPPLRRSKGTIVNNLSLAAIANQPAMPGYSISKAASSSMTQYLRASLAADGVSVHGVYIGPVDTEMNDGLDIPVPMASPQSVAQGIFDGLERGEEDIFPDPVAQTVADAWRTGVSKGLERQFAAFVRPSVT